MKEGDFYQSKSNKITSICLVSTKKYNRRPRLLQTWQKGLICQGRTNSGGIIGRRVRGDSHIEPTNHTILHYTKLRLCSFCNYSTPPAPSILDCSARIRIYIYTTHQYTCTHTRTALAQNGRSVLHPLEGFRHSRWNFLFKGGHFTVFVVHWQLCSLVFSYSKLINKRLIIKINTYRGSHPTVYPRRWCCRSTWTSRWIDEHPSEMAGCARRQFVSLDFRIFSTVEFGST